MGDREIQALLGLPFCLLFRTPVLQNGSELFIFYCYISNTFCFRALQWGHNGRDGVSNHQPRDFFFNRLFRRRSKKTSKLRVIGHCARNSPVTGESPAQLASYTENASAWWRHHGQKVPILACLLMHLSCVSGLRWIKLPITTLKIS